MPLFLIIPEFFGISIEVYFIVLFLAGSLFYLWRWLFRKVTKSKLTAAIAAWIAAFITAPFAYICLIGLWIAWVSYYPRNDFDKHKWVVDKEHRYQLSENIIESKILLGKTKPEVKQLLGEDEGTQNDSDYWQYHLGYKPSMFGIDPDVLDVHFKDGKVVEVGQHET